MATANPAANTTTAAKEPATDRAALLAYDEGRAELPAVGEGLLGTEPAEPVELPDDPEPELPVATGAEVEKPDDPL